MKIFNTSQIRQIDQYTIEQEPVSSIDLMERAADSILQQLTKDLGDIKQDIFILAGPGNNGGDGLALGRMLRQYGYEAAVLLLHTGNLSPDCSQNKNRFVEYFSTYFEEQTTTFNPPVISPQTVIIDALFGSGLSRPLEGVFKEAVEWINSVGNNVISIDIPSGICGEGACDKNDIAVKASTTYSLQFPKLAFLLSENELYVNDWKTIDIELHPDAIANTESPFIYLEKKEIQPILKPRKRFSHKGTFGHLLIWAGKSGMGGAAVLAAKGALRAGAGLVSVHSAEENRIILQTSVPEAIFLNELDNQLEAYNAFAFGPGLGTDDTTTEKFANLLKSMQKPCVLDADALNMLAGQKSLLDFIPEKSILTPHPKEFERIFGVSENSLERIKSASEEACKRNIIIVLKGANTLIATPDGRCYFNSTGNSGMAVGGMGDVLTGIISGLLAQGYSSEESAVLGVYLHGLAGDLALNEQSEESLLPTDLIEKLGCAFNKIKAI